jgi:hypothetical protein
VARGTAASRVSQPESIRRCVAARAA